MYSDPLREKAYQQSYYLKNKKAVKAKNANTRKRIKEFVERAKSVPCKDCRQTYPPYVMDFDHTDPSKKTSDVNALVGRRAFRRIVLEIAHCEVVCSNCHRIRTFSRRTCYGGSQKRAKSAVKPT